MRMNGKTPPRFGAMGRVETLYEELLNFIEGPIFAEPMKTVVIHLESVTDEAQFHQELKTSLGLPDYYGANYAALVDCLSSLRHPEDEMISISLASQEVLVIEISGLTPQKFDLLLPLIFALRQVNERQRLKGNAPMIWLQF